MSLTDNSATLTFSSCCLSSLEVDNNSKRLVLPNCQLVTPVLLLLVLHEMLEFCMIQIWSLMLRLEKHVVQVTTIARILERSGKLNLTLDSTRCLVHALVMGRVDYCNSLLYGLPRNNTNKLQRLQNMAARLITNTPRFCQITPVLCQLHWLPISVRIKFNVILTIFKAIHGLVPHYVQNLIEVIIRRSPPTTLGQMVNCHWLHRRLSLKRP